MDREASKHLHDRVQSSQWDLPCDAGRSTRGSGTTERGGMGGEVGGTFKREGTYACLWLIHGDVWQKPAHYCKATLLQ